jgi:hypothetical protein
MKFTLKLKKHNAPLFIQSDNSLNNNPTNDFIEFDTLNLLAESLLNKKHTMSDDIQNRYVVSKSDIASLNSEKQISNLTSQQDFNSDIKLLNVDDLKYIAQRRAAKLYLKNLKLDLLDPRVEKLEIIQIPKIHSEHFKIGDLLIRSSDYSAKIFYYMETHTIIDEVNIEELNENRKIDSEKYAYLAIIPTEFMLKN